MDIKLLLNSTDDLPRQDQDLENTTTKERQSQGIGESALSACSPNQVHPPTKPFHPCLTCGCCPAWIYWAGYMCQMHRQASLSRKPFRPEDDAALLYIFDSALDSPYRAIRLALGHGRTATVARQDALHEHLPDVSCSLRRSLVHAYKKISWEYGRINWNPTRYYRDWEIDVIIRPPPQILQGERFSLPIIVRAPDQVALTATMTCGITATQWSYEEVPLSGEIFYLFRPQTLDQPGDWRMQIYLQGNSNHKHTFDIRVHPKQGGG